MLFQPSFCVQHRRPPLFQLTQDTERSAATMPTQLHMHMVAMLAKNPQIERPTTLTSVLYRVWCRLRKDQLDAWQTNLPDFIDHDRARPGPNVLYIALGRLMRQEVI